MEQGFLFEPKAVAQAELQEAIWRLDFPAASRKLEELRRFWPEADTGWEAELLRFESKLADGPIDLDSGFTTWEKAELRLNRRKVSESWTAGMRRNFFSRLLASNRRLFEEPRPSSGRSLGDFYLLAGQPNNARRRYEKEIRELGDSWQLRLQLGNCNVLLGQRSVGCSNYLNERIQ